jgi:hypothetical protein
VFVIGGNVTGFRARTASAALAAALLLSAVPARADTEAILLDYDAGAGCPDRKQFVQRVHTFTTKAEIVSDNGAPRRKFAVQVSRAGNVVRGELTIDDRGAKTTRDVSGATCDEVISALALATAIAVDPDALGGAPPDEPSKPPPTEPPPTQPKPAVAAPPPPPAGGRPSKPADAAAPDSRPPVLYLSGGGRVGNAISPFPKFDVAGELGCTYFAPFEFYVGAAYGPPQHNDTLRLEDWLGWLGVGYRIFELEPISVLTLAAVEGGDVHAGGGPDVVPAYSRHRPWVAVNVGLAARVDALGPLFLQANVGARAPVLLQRYVETTNKGQAELYQVELGYLVGISVGIHFL